MGPDGAVVSLRAFLDEKDADQRRARLRAWSVAPADDGERRALVHALLSDDDAGVRRDAVALVAKWAEHAPLDDALAHALASDSLACRTAALDVLARRKSQAVSVCARLIAHPNEGVRRLAVDALGATEDRAAFDAILPATKDTSAAVRAAAFEAIARAAPARSGPVLAAGLAVENESASVRLSILLCVDRLRVDIDPKLAEAALADPITAGPAVRVLGRIGDVRVVIDEVERHGGTRLRASLAALVDAIMRAPVDVAAALAKRKPPFARTDEVLHGTDAAAIAGLVALAVIHHRDTLFPRIAQRPDRSLLLPHVLRVVALLGDGRLKRTLASLAETSHDPGAGHFLAELAATVHEAPRPERSAQSFDTPFALDDESFKRLAALFLDQAGLAFEEHTRFRLAARLTPRVIEAGLPSMAAYADLISSTRGAAERQRALEVVTIHETYFFREPHQLDVLARVLLPVLATVRPRHAPFAVWSAGTSTGEEAWTAAILLAQSGLFSTFEVVGTDLSQDAIAHARTGRYSARAFRGEYGADLAARYFDRIDGELRVKDELKPHVRFLVRNLFKEDAPGALFDVILCRNVLIYVAPEARARLIERFYEALAPGGVLLLGHSESLLNAKTSFRFVPVNRELVYVKPLADGRTPPFPGGRA